MPEGFEEGKAEGLDHGRTEGLASGRLAGFDEGRQIGYEDGFKDGYERGRKDEHVRAMEAFDKFMDKDADEGSATSVVSISHIVLRPVIAHRHRKDEHDLLMLWTCGIAEAISRYIPVFREAQRYGEQ